MVETQEVSMFEDAIQEPEVFSFNHANGRFTVSDTAVEFVEIDDSGETGKTKRVCSYLKVTAQTRDTSGHNWGRLLEWKDGDGTLHKWSMPMELLKARDPSDMRGELLSRGLKISDRNLLTAYIQESPTPKRVLCVDRLGWYGKQFVTPDSVIGSNDDVVFQSATSTPPAFGCKGSLNEWQNEISRYSVGNNRLTFAISLAFAPPLMDLADIEGGGFHIRGGSSMGKSTIQHVAGSVWGRSTDYVKNWRVTSNGMEGLAVMHNDGLLILDEISQIHPTHLADTAYMLANGQGKVRSNKSGVAKPAYQWRLMMLSSGEESLAQILAKANLKANAGQEVRLADIEADAGNGLGAFDCLHDMPSSAGLSDHLKTKSNQVYGCAGIEWLNWLVTYRNDKSKDLSNVVKITIDNTVKSWLPNGADGQIMRVAKRFVLVAVAGEMATVAGITGWETEEATKAVKVCFDNWLAGFGDTDRETSNILNHVRGFIEAHGASRFENNNSNGEERIINRVGFVRVRKNDDGTDGDGLEYLVMPEAFKNEICKGHDPKQVIKVLRDAGILKTANDGKSQINAKTPDGQKKLYCLIGEKL